MATWVGSRLLLLDPFLVNSEVSRVACYAVFTRQPRITIDTVETHIPLFVPTNHGRAVLKLYGYVKRHVNNLRGGH